MTAPKSTRICRKCRRALSPSHFDRQRRTAEGWKHGYQPYCRECRQIHKRPIVVPDMPGEQWRSVPDYEGYYEVSNYGRMRRDLTRSSTYPGFVLKPRTDRTGYLYVIVSKNGAKRTFRLHTLVALVFLGPRSDGMEVHHRDFNRANPHVDNLEYVTPTDNHIHSLFNESPSGGGKYRRKLTAADVIAIRTSDVRSGILARQYGVCRSTIHAVRNGKKWAAVTTAAHR